MLVRLKIGGAAAALALLMLVAADGRTAEALPESVATQLEALCAGCPVSEALSGELFGDDNDALVVRVYRLEPDWRAYQIAVFRREASDDYRLIDATGLVSYNEKGEESLRVEKGSIFVASSWPGMRVATSTTRQYRFNGDAFEQIGEERESFFHGDTIPEPGEEEVRVSTNFVTGTVIEYGPRGIRSSPGPKVRPLLRDLAEQGS